MSCTTIEHGIATDEGLKSFQQKVIRVFAELVVTNGDGEKLRTFTAKAEMQSEPKVTIKDLVLGFVDQWIKFYNEVHANVIAKSFGHLSDNEKTAIDVLQITGLAMLTGLKRLEKEAVADSHSRNHYLDMAIALRSINHLQRSYERNPSNEELIRLIA